MTLLKCSFSWSNATQYTYALFKNYMLHFYKCFDFSHVLPAFFAIYVYIFIYFHVIVLLGVEAFKKNLLYYIYIHM